MKPNSDSFLLYIKVWNISKKNNLRNISLSFLFSWRHWCTTLGKKKNSPSLPYMQLTHWPCHLTVTENNNGWNHFQIYLWPNMVMKQCLYCKCRWKKFSSWFLLFLFFFFFFNCLCLNCAMEPWQDYACDNHFRKLTPRADLFSILWYWGLSAYL